MEKSLWKNIYTAEYRFAKDVVKEVIELRTIYSPNSVSPQFLNTIFTPSQRDKIKVLFAKEWSRLDELVRRFTVRNGSSDYGDMQFLLCVVQIIEDYTPELRSEDMFVLVCARITYVASCFLRENHQSDAVNISVDRVFEILLDTFYPSEVVENITVKDAKDHRYRFSYDIVKTLMEMRGFPVGNLEHPDLNNLFLDRHKIIIKELFSREWYAIDEMVRTFACKDGDLDYSDSNYKFCMHLITDKFKHEQVTEEGFVLLCARIAYAAAYFQRKNSESDAPNLAVDRVHKILKGTSHFKNKIKGKSLLEEFQDDNYKFAHAIVYSVLTIRSNIHLKIKKPHLEKSTLTVSRRNEVINFLSREWPCLQESIRNVTKTDDSSKFNDNQFLMCMNQIINDHISELKSEQCFVLVCVRIAYIATCFFKENKKSTAIDLAVDRIYEMRKNILLFNESTQENSIFVDVRNDHYRFVYELISTVVEMSGTSGPDLQLPDPDNVLFTGIHRNKIKKLLHKERFRLDEIVNNFANSENDFNFSDDNFLQCADQIFKDYKHQQITENGFVCICARIAYAAVCFLRKNHKSNVMGMAIDRIYNMVKDIMYFNKTIEDNPFMKDIRDDKYRFAYDIVKTVLGIRGTPMSDVDLPLLRNLLFTAKHKKKIEQLISKEWSCLDELIKTSTCCKDGYPDYSETNFLKCMDLIVKECKPEQYSEEGFVLLCGKIAYAASSFLMKSYKSNATQLAVNRIHEMVKDVFSRGTLKRSSW